MNKELFDTKKKIKKKTVYFLMNLAEDDNNGL
jgi:hypothetical protein